MREKTKISPEKCLENDHVRKRGLKSPFFDYENESDHVGVKIPDFLIT